MGEVLYMKDSPLFNKDAKSPRAGDEVELTYPAKEGSVEVGLSTTPDGVCHFKVVAPADDVAASIASARAALATSFGVAPEDEEGLEVIRQHMGDATFSSFITTFVQQHFLTKAYMRTGVLPFLTPDYLTSEAPVEGNDYTFEAEALLRPFIELTSYDPVKLDELAPKPEVSSKDVTAYLEGMANELGTWENDSSRTEAAAGDHVTLNLDTTLDDKPVRELTGRHIPYLVGSQVLGEEFDRQIEGMKPRERREFGLSMPAQAPDGSIAYQVVQVKAQLDEIQKKVPAKIDDVWVVKNMPEAGTLLGLRARVRTLLERETEAAYREQVMAECADKLSERLVAEPADRYVQKMKEELIAQFIDGLARQGVDYQEFMQQPGFDHDAWEAEMETSAKDALRRALALDSLADHLDIQLDASDIGKLVQSMAPGQEDEVAKSLIDSGQLPRMCEVALRVRANEWLVDQVLGPRKNIIGSVIEGSAEPRTQPGKPASDGPKLQLI